MTLPRIKSILLVAVGAIAGSVIVLLLHWSRRSAQENIPTPTPLAYRYANRTSACHGHSVQVTADNIMLYHAICNISSGNEIAQFSGHSMSHLFDKGNTKLHYTINEKFRAWSEVAKQLNQTQFTGMNQSIANGAVHMHNTHKLGDFMLLFWTEYFRFGPNGKSLKQGKDATPLNSAQFAWAIDKNQPPIVITNWGDENWGHLSAPIGTRTTKWLNLTNHLRIHNSNYETVRMLLDSPKVVLMVTNTHVALDIGNHTKIICLPLGMKAKQAMLTKGIKLLSKPYKKNTVLRINNSGWGDRTKINALVSKAFNNTIQNTYSVGKGGPAVDHHLAAAQAQFVLCPSGLGFDTYRLWETLLVGSIPVVESNPGLDRTYSNLPVLVVRNYSDLTPELLQRAYPCFLRHAHQYNYKHLTQSYWLNLIDVAIVTGKVDHVTREQPFRNKYCDFL
eukprot:gene12554-14518_t